jgi:glycosyltransferase involved in cell wall biosynthesis
MKISVIIPTYNEARYITGCIDSLKKQTLKPLEIIIVDDGSIDNTRELVSGCVLFKQRHQGAGSARNLGASKAKGDILVFVDADMEFDRDFLKQLTVPIMSGNTKGTFSKNEYVRNWSNPWAKSWNHLSGLSSNRAIPENFPNKSPVFRAILKSEFDRVGGFDISYGYDDDWTLSQKLGFKATLVPGAKYYHFNPSSPKEIFRQARWQGSRRFKFGSLGKLFNLSKVLLLTPTLISPLFLFLRFRHPHSFLAKIVYDLGFILGLLGSRKLK